jgi:hypothetical protein
LRRVAVKHKGIIAAITLVILTGIALASHYGASYDEGNTVPYGRTVLGAYLHLTAPESWDGNLKYYGPFYFALTEAATTVLGFVGVPWTSIELRHFIYFLSLPIAMASLYSLAVRWVAIGPALIGTILFATQPLIFGHAFINPKDMPFLAFFTLSMAMGLWMVDKMDRRGIWFGSGHSISSSSWRVAWGDADTSIRSTSRKKAWILVVFSAGALILAVEILIAQRLILPALLSTTRNAFHQTSLPIINQLFAQIAEQSSELASEAYVAKAVSTYHMWSRPAALLAFLPALVVLSSILSGPIGKVRPRGLMLAIALAGAALGLATSIRLVGPLVGLLVSAAAAVSCRKGAAVPLVLYWTAAGLLTYLSWPYLWDAPFERAWESYQVISNFNWEFSVLFRGELYAGNDLPRYYVPYLFGIQLTLPALILAAAGVALAIRQANHMRSRVIEFTVAAAWFLVPLLTAMLLLPAYYDNARQFLFILPPIFLFGSLMLEVLWGAVRSSLLRLISIAVILLPGMVGLIRLHPYQYVYYNELVGGVGGAYRRYELDYLTTSLTEGLEIVSAIAPPAATVFVNGPWDYGWTAARQDLRIYDPPENEFDPKVAQYLVLTTRANSDEPFRAGAEVVEEIGIAGVPLSLVMEAADGY